MFKKNQNVNGLSFSMISKTDGSDISTGVVWADLVQDGGVFVDLIAQPIHRVNSLWTANISAAEMNFDLVSVTFKHTDGIPVTYNIKTDTKLVSDLTDFNPTTTLVNANVYSINSNTDAAIQLQQKVPRIDGNITSRAAAGAQMDLIDAPNSTAITAIQNGISTFDNATDIVNANVYSINSNTISSIMLQQFIPRIDTNISSRSTFNYATDTVNANVTMVDGSTVEVVNVVNANIYSINSNTDAAIMLQQFIPRIDTNISSRAVAGDQMDFVNAPNSTAITAIQNGLSTFDFTTDTVNANVYAINSNTEAAILLQSYIPRIDTNISSRSTFAAATETVKANVIQVAGTTVEIAGIVNANIAQIASNTAAAISLAQNVVRLDDNISSRSTFNAATDTVVKANVYSINANTNAAVLLASEIPRLDANITSRSVAGDQMDFVNAPNSTAITAIQNGLSTFDSTTDLVNANVYSINSNTDAAIALQQNIVRLDSNVSNITVNNTAIAQEIFNTAVDGSVIFSDAIKRILAMVVNAQIITGTDPITLVGRNSANTANIVIQTHPVANPTGRTVTFN